MQAALVKLSASTHIRKRWRPDGRKGSVGKGATRKRNGDENSPNYYRSLWTCQRKPKLKDKHMSFSLYSLRAVVATESPASALSSDQDPFLSHAQCKACWWGTSCYASCRDVSSTILSSAGSRQTIFTQQETIEETSLLLTLSCLVSLWLQHIGRGLSPDLNSAARKTGSVTPPPPEKGQKWNLARF